MFYARDLEVNSEGFFLFFCKKMKKGLDKEEKIVYNCRPQTMRESFERVFFDN